jgi:hypothetical protein
VSAIVACVFLVNVALAALATATVLRPGALTDIAALACAAVLVGGQLWCFARGRS